MPDFCGIDLQIAGKEEAVQELVQMLSRKGPFAEGGLVGLGRVFSFDLDEGLTRRDSHDASLICVQGFGDCAWSINEAIIECDPVNLESECKRLGVVVEAFSSMPGKNGFQEHYLCNKGVFEAAERVAYEEYVVPNMSPDEIKDLAAEKHMTVEELMSKVNHNDEYTEGGIANYCEFRDLLQYFTQEKSVKFILDDEFMVGDDIQCKTVNGYLWATDVLVAQLKAQEAKNSPGEDLSGMDNINFYGVYDLQNNTVSLQGSYYLGDSNYRSFSLPLSDADKADLISAMEEYCKQRNNGRSCLETLNEVRTENGMLTVAGMNELLAKLQQVDTIEYKGIVFDEWTVDQETGGIYGEMCQCCADKYKDLLDGELDDGDAIGVCSVKGCNTIGIESDASHYYIDFKPEHIRVVERKPSLDELCANAEARTRTKPIPENTISKSHSEKR